MTDSRDEGVAAYNAALAAGDAAGAERLGDALLRDVHRRIMDDDSRYAEAGWKPTAPTLLQAVREVFPNADPWWCGHASENGCVIDFDGTTLVVTPEGSDEWFVGVYPGDTWGEGDEPADAAVCRSPAEVVAALQVHRGAIRRAREARR